MRNFYGKPPISIIKNFGEENYIYNPFPSMGSEDFAYYGEIIPAAMYRLGTGFINQKMQVFIPQV